MIDTNPTSYLTITSNNYPNLHNMGMTMLREHGYDNAKQHDFEIDSDLYELSEADLVEAEQGLASASEDERYTMAVGCEERADLIERKPELAPADLVLGAIFEVYCGTHGE